MNFNPLSHPATTVHSPRQVQIEHQTTLCDAALNLPVGATGLVVVAHPESGARWKPRNRYLAQWLALQNLGVLQVELVMRTEENGRRGQFQEEHIELVAERLVNAVQWARQQPYLRALSIGCLGFGAGGTAALMAAGTLASAIDALAVVDAQPKLAGIRMATILAATLLVVIETHDFRRRMNEIAHLQLRSEKQMKVLPGTTALATGEALEEVATLVTRWFRYYLHPNEHFLSERLFAHA